MLLIHTLLTLLRRNYNKEFYISFFTWKELVVTVVLLFEKKWGINILDYTCKEIGIVKLQARFLKRWRRHELVEPLYIVCLSLRSLFYYCEVLSYFSLLTLPVFQTSACTLGQYICFYVTRILRYDGENLEVKGESGRVENGESCWRCSEGVIKRKKVKVSLFKKTIEILFLRELSSYYFCN